MPSSPLACKRFRFRRRPRSVAGSTSRCCQKQNTKRHQATIQAERLTRVRRRPPDVISQRAVWKDLGDPELTALPGHVGMIPGQPGQVRPVRTQLGRRIKVISLNQDWCLRNRRPSRLS